MQPTGYITFKPAFQELELQKLKNAEYVELLGVAMRLLRLTFV
jgi:hypothetical protein